MNMQRPNSKIPEPLMPDSLIGDGETTLVGDMDLPAVLDELARQLTVTNDFYYPLLSAAGQLRSNR